MRPKPYVRTPEMTRVLEAPAAARQNARVEAAVLKTGRVKLPDVALQPVFGHIAGARRGHRVGPHLHTAIELFRMERGTSNFVIQGQPVRFESGDIALIPARHIHEWACPSGAVEFLGFAVDLIPVSRDVLTLGHRVPQAAQALNYRIPRNPLIHGALDAFRSEIECGGEDAETVAATHLALVLALMARALRIAIASPVPAAANVDRDERRVAAALAYIRAHLSEPMTVESVAMAAGVTRRHLNRLFARNGLRSIQAAIEQERIVHARWLLESTEHPVKSVGMLSGFSDAAYFCRVFRKVTGLAPSVARRDSL